MDIQYLEFDFEVIDLDEQPEPDCDAADDAAARADAAFMGWFTDSRSGAAAAAFN